ncbi:hypothetical protein FOA52_005090 [Chlamydomonas sp. UWO 241]|nr:hypothetical protein FOA52_005090 [Chlamydomonas sp. UWO 241]
MRCILPPLLVLSGALLLLLGSGALVEASDSQEERLIGWQGETWDAKAGIKRADEQEAVAEAAHATAHANRTRWVETVSWSPRAFLFHNFLTVAECDHLVDIGTKRVERSLVVDAKTGSSRLDDIRTSFGAAFGRGEDSVIAGVEEKIAEWTHLPADLGEPMQILRYVDGQKYGAHWDWFDDVNHPQGVGRDGDNRYATVLMYLSDDVEGGETALPLAVGIDPPVQQARISSPSECVSKGSGIAVIPHKGDALLFFDMDVEGRMGDRSALHASCPTTGGTKWTATKWIHNHAYGGSYNALQKAMKCFDEAHDCAERERREGCAAESMTGLGGACRKLCKDCVDCASGDLVCGRGNMKGRYVAPR